MPPKLTVEGKRTWPLLEETSTFASLRFDRFLCFIFYFLDTTDYSALFFYFSSLRYSTDFSALFFFFFPLDFPQNSPFCVFFLLFFPSLFLPFYFLVLDIVWDLHSKRRFFCFRSSASSPCLIERLWRSQMKECAQGTGSPFLKKGGLSRNKANPADKAKYGMDGTLGCQHMVCWDITRSQTTDIPKSGTWSAIATLPRDFISLPAFSSLRISSPYLPPLRRTNRPCKIGRSNAAANMIIIPELVPFGWDWQISSATI